jgi:hypothetical protein
MSVAVDPQGNVFIGERDNVLKITNLVPKPTFSAELLSKTGRSLRFDAIRSKDPEGEITRFA